MGQRLTKPNGYDKVYTPSALARSIVAHYKPFDVLEPCRGAGAFTEVFRRTGLRHKWCEIDDGRDFFQLKSTKCKWIVTNPPFSQIRNFLLHSYKLGVPNIVFLCTLNAFWMNGKLNDMRLNGYAITEIALVESPYARRQNNWPQSGFSLAATLIQQVKIQPKFIRYTNLKW